MAVDRKVIPLGTHLYVEGYGYAVAAGVGGAVKGDRIHLSLNAGNPTCPLPQGDLNPSIRKKHLYKLIYL